MHLKAQKEKTLDLLTSVTGVASLPVLLFFSGCCLVEAPSKAQKHYDRLQHEATINLEILRMSGNEDIWLHRYGTLQTPFFCCYRSIHRVCDVC